MLETTTTPPKDLLTLITEALHAYKLALATRIQMERAAQQEHEQRLATAESTRQATIQQLESERQQAETQAVAEQERMGHLLAIIQEVEQGASDLLHKASLAHIAGAPLSVDSTAAPVRRTDETVAAAFTAVQLATADLQAGLLRLAQAFIDSSRWDEARRVLQPLLSDTKSTYHVDANNLRCESYYIPAVAALKSQNWTDAREGFEAVLLLNSAYRDTYVMLRESYIRPAKLALDTANWIDARQYAMAWLNKRKGDVEARDLLYEAYYLPAAAALNAQDWANARQGFEAVLQVNPEYRDTLAMHLEAYFRPANLNPKLWQDVHDQAKARLEGLSANDPARIVIQKQCQEVLCEAHYQLGMRAIHAKDWKSVADHLRGIWQAIPGRHHQMHGVLSLRYYEATWKIAPDYKDTKAWPQRYPLSRWRIGWIVGVGIIRHPDEYLQSIAFSLDGKILASASYSKLCLWEVESQQGIFETEFPWAGNEYVLFRQISFNNNHTLTGFGNTGSPHYKGYSVLFDMQTKKFSSLKSVPYGGAGGLKQLSIPGEDLYIDQQGIIDEDGNQLFYSEFVNQTEDVAISPNGTLFATAHNHSYIRLWRPKA